MIIASGCVLRLAEGGAPISSWPNSSPPSRPGCANAPAISVGDLGVIALFGTHDNATLPLYLYQKMASYRMDEAAVIALFLIAMCLGLFATLERAVGGRS